MTVELMEELISAVEDLKVIVGIEIALAIIFGCTILGLGAMSIMAEWRNR